MLIPLERLLTRLRQPKSRADELIALRVRLREELASTHVDDEERQLANAAHAAKLAVVAELAGVMSCRSCAKDQPAPVGTFEGGACCSGVTSDLFEDTELAALALAGLRPAHLTPPPGSDAHAGCTFRGAHGCTLDPAHRPNRCTHYICDGLWRELHRRGQMAAVEAKLGELNRAMQAFAVVHKARTDREVLAPLIEALERR